jgi:DDE_Tnp_1-associated
VSLEKRTWVQVQKLDIPDEGLMVWLRNFGQIKLFRTRLKNQLRHYVVCLPDADGYNTFGCADFQKLHNQHADTSFLNTALSAQRHDLKEIIVMTLSAVLCGANNWVDVAECARDNESWLKKYLVLENGTPSHDSARSRSRCRWSARSTLAPKALPRPRLWPRQPGATGALKTACTGCSMSRFARMNDGCVQGARRAIYRRYESSP